MEGDIDPGLWRGGLRDMLFYNLALSASFGESRYTGKRRTPMVLKKALNVGRWGTLGKQYAVVICCATCAEEGFAVRMIAADTECR